MIRTVLPFENLPPKWYGRARKEEHHSHSTGTRIGLEFGLQFLRDDGHTVGEPAVKGNVIFYPVENDLWSEDRVREVGRQAAEAQLERNRGDDLARLLAEPGWIPYRKDERA